MIRYVIADPQGFEHVVDVDVESGAIRGSENLCHGFEDASPHERMVKAVEIVRAAHLGNELPYGYRRVG